MKRLFLLLPTVLFFNYGLNAMPKQEAIVLYEALTRKLERTVATVSGREVFLPVSFVSNHLQFEPKELAPGLVGMCRDDLCIPLTIQNYQGTDHVSSQVLVESLGGTYLWDEEDRLLLLNTTYGADTGADAEAWAGLTLSDLDGRPAPLEAFRGKKLVLFAWASW